MTVYVPSVLDALDNVLSGRTDSSSWLTIVEIMEELTRAYNANPVRLHSRGLSADTYIRWCEYVDRNQALGFTYRDVARLLEGRGYQRGVRHEEKSRVHGVTVPVWGPR